MDIELWVDPICPWCWVTARWLIDEVAPARALHITWRPFSLLVKNATTTDSPYFTSLERSYGLLRVMEAVRAHDGERSLQRLYLAYGTRIHHRRDTFFDVGDALAEAGLDRAYADALTQPQWDEPLLRQHHAGLALVGNDVGTPILAVPDADGTPCGIYGPIITRVPGAADALRLWDGVVACVSTEGFWELKRTRTVRPDPGPEPVAI